MVAKTPIVPFVRLLVCGDRDWTDTGLIRSWMVLFKKMHAIEPFVVIEGEARGADSIARDIALELGYTILSFPANWTKYGRAAGPIRNAEMLKRGKPDVVLAFHDNLVASKGTRDMVTRARAAGIETKVITHKD